MTTETLVTPVVYHGYNIAILPVEWDEAYTQGTRYHWHIWRVGEHGRFAEEGKRTEKQALRAAQRRVRQLAKGA